MSAEAAEAVAVLLVRIGAERLALPVASVREVLDEPVTPVPRAPPFVAGVSNLRWQVLTVLDPRAWLGLPPRAPGDRSPIVVLAQDALPVGLLVDETSGIAHATADPRDALAVRVDGERVPLLDAAPALRPPRARRAPAGGAA